MSLLNYFQKLPPDTPNVASASSGLTSQETEEVSKELKKIQDKGKKRKKYCVWTPQQRLEIGKHAAKNDLSEGIVMKSRGRSTLLPETLMKK